MDESLLAPRTAWALLQDGRAQLIGLRGRAEVGIRAWLDGGVDLLRLSEEELVGERYSPSDSRGDIIAGARRLQAAGARRVLVSRGSAPAVLIEDGGDPRIEALRLGMAAGALNTTRRGLGTGTRDEVERLAAHVSVRS